MNIVVSFIPYAAVLIGMYGIRSAWAALGMYHAGMLAVVLFSQRRFRGREEQSVSAGWLPLIALVYAAGGAALYVLWPYLNPDSSAIADRLAVYGINRHTWPWLAVYFIIVNSTLEELFWRGGLGSDSVRPVAADFMFGGYHVLVLLAFTLPIWAAPVFVCCAFAGWLWRMLRMWTGGLAVPMVTHVVADVGIVVAVHFRVFG